VTKLKMIPDLLSMLSRAALWLSGIGLVLMTLFVGWQVFGRYVMNDSPSWTEPASLLLMSWFILLGSAVGVREGSHLGFETILHYSPAPLRRVMLAVGEILVAGFGLAMSWFGWIMTVDTWSSNMAGLPIPQGMDYLPLAIGGGLIALFSLEKLARLLIADEQVPMVEPDQPHLVVVQE
jgi:TRAP-type C4-dicarboxylate transport system permease small subunit